MRTSRDMFIYFLNDMYSIESAALSLTRDFANKAKDTEIKRGLEEHVEETERQMRRLRSIIRRYGGKVSAAKATIFSILSIGTNAFQWIQTNPRQEELRMLYDEMMIESMEIGGYKALIAMAKSLGDMQTVSELLLSLEEETAMSERAEKQILNYLKQVA